MVSQANSIRRRLFGRTLIIAALLIALLATLVTSGTALAQTDAQDPAYGTENTAPTVAPPEATVPVTTQPEPPAHACGDCGAGIGDRATEEVVEDGGAQSCGGECGVRVGKEASRGIGGRPPDGGSGAANVRYGGGSDKIDGRQAYVAALEAARSTRPPSNDPVSVSTDDSSISTEGAFGAEGPKNERAENERAASDQSGAVGSTGSGTKTGSGGRETTTESGGVSEDGDSAPTTTGAGAPDNAATPRDSATSYYLPGTALLIGGIFVARRMFLRR